jgi:hypothetical protein
MMSRSGLFSSAVIALIALVPGSLPALAADATGINVELPATTRTTYSIGGAVHRQAGGTAVAGVVVTAFNSSTSRTATTGANGTYTVIHLLPGQYHLSFQPPGSTNTVGGYLDGSSPQHYTPDYPGIAVTITAHDLTGQNSNLPSGHAIQGRITSNGPTGVDGAAVAAHLDSASRNAFASTGTYQAVTSSNGSYSITGVPSGSYTVSVTAPAASNLQSGCYATGAPSHFSGNCATHASVHVSNANATGISVRLPVGLTVTGQVLDRSNLPIFNAQVTTHSATAGELDNDTTMTLDDGTFTLQGVTPGTYTLGVVAPAGSRFLNGWYLASDSVNHWTRSGGSASTIHVSANTAIATIRPLGGYTISGMITRESGGAAVEAATVSAVNYNSGATLSVTTDSSGNFTVGPVPSGTYMVHIVRPSAAPELESGYFDQPNVPTRFTAETSQSSLLSVTSNWSNVNVQVPTGATISGRVKVGGVGYAATVSATETGTHAVVMTVAANDGTYSVEGLPAGNYIVQFQGGTSYPTATTQRTVGDGFYKAGAPHNSPRAARTRHS